MQTHLTSIIVATAIVLSLALAAHAQQRTFYDSSTGRVSGRSTTGTNGATTYYDSGGRVTGRSTIGSDGTVTFYDAHGRRTGTTPRPQSR